MAQQLNDNHYQTAYKLTIKKELDRDEIKDLSKELNESDEYDRNGNSAEFLLSRMHILVHGLAPHGETEARAETMFTICGKMIDFANRMGLDTIFNIELARFELKNRPVQINRETAKRIMVNFYHDNKDSLSIEYIRTRRETIIAQLMMGVTVEEAFTNA